MLSRPNESPLTRSCVFPSPKPVRTIGFLLGSPIAITIAEKPDVGRGRDEHAAEARQHAVGKRKPIGEDGRMLITTVAVAVFQSPDPSRGRCDRIIDHLGDIEPPVFVPGDRDRAGHLGLGGHQLDREGRVGQREGRLLVARRSRPLRCRAAVPPPAARLRRDHAKLWPEAGPAIQTTSAFIVHQ